MSCLVCGSLGFYADARVPAHPGESGFRNNHPHPPPPAELSRQRQAAGLPVDALDVMVVGETRPIVPGAPR